MCEKLNDPITAPKTYWKIIIPLLLVNGEINFSQKASIFNKFFSSQLLHYKIQAVYLPRI